MPIPAVLPSNFGFTSGIQVYFWTQRKRGENAAPLRNRGKSAAPAAARCLRQMRFSLDLEKRRALLRGRHEDDLVVRGDLARSRLADRLCELVWSRPF